MPTTWQRRKYAYYGTVIFDSAGNLYGTTATGGGSECSGGCGTVYELSPSGSGWTEHILYRFTGGSGCRGYGCGTVYELSPSGSGWTAKVLCTFQNASDGENPYAGVIFDHAGNLYGATFTGGSQAGGTVFQLSPSGEGWSFSTLYAFKGGNTVPPDPMTIWRSMALVLSTERPTTMVALRTPGRYSSSLPTTANGSTTASTFSANPLAIPMAKTQ